MPLIPLYTPDLAPEPLERRYALPPSRFLEVEGLRVHYRDEGDGPPLLLLHGLTANLFDWQGWAERLRDRHRVIRLDLPGHGLTGPDPRQRYAWPEAAALVLAFLDRLGVRRASVAGSSYGGAIAWHLAAQAPERVDRLILLAPIGYPMPGRPPLPIRLLRHPLAGPVVARLTYRRAFLDSLRHAFGDPARLDEATAERQFALFRRAGNRDALRATLRTGPIPDPRPLLARVRAPTLLLWGTADRITPPALAHRFAADLPNARVAEVEGAGHALALEAPDASAAAALEFLRADSVA